VNSGVCGSFLQGEGSGGNLASGTPTGRIGHEPALKPGVPDQPPGHDQGGHHGADLFGEGVEPVSQRDAPEGDPQKDGNRRAGITMIPKPTSQGPPPEGNGEPEKGPLKEVSWGQGRRHQNHERGHGAVQGAEEWGGTGPPPRLRKKSGHETGALQRRREYKHLIEKQISLTRGAGSRVGGGRGRRSPLQRGLIFPFLGPCD
jgi:hypothetical protein